LRVPIICCLAALIEEEVSTFATELAAINVGATQLLSGDFLHRGSYYGVIIAGVLILSPGEYLPSRIE